MERSSGIYWPRCKYTPRPCLSSPSNLAVERREEDVPEGDEPHGHVTSISVLRSYRRLGLAKRLMIQSREFIFLPSSFVLYTRSIGF